MELPKYCTVSFLPRDRYSHTERLSNWLKMKEEEQHKAGWAWMNNRQSIMDDKLTKFPLSASLSLSFSYISYIHFLTVFSLPLLFFFKLFSSFSVLFSHCDTMSLLWGTCSGRRRWLPSSLEPLSCLWKRAALLYGLLKSPGDVLSSLCFSEKSD